MAERAPARLSSTTIQIVLGSPPNPQNSSASEVYFQCQSKCWIWTSVDGGSTWESVFTGQTNNYVDCSARTGLWGPYTPAVAVGTVITIGATVPNSSGPPTAHPKAVSVRGTITVTS